MSFQGQSEPTVLPAALEVVRKDEDGKRALGPICLSATKLLDHLELSQKRWRKSKQRIGFL